jgi:hypothetical protein
MRADPEIWLCPRRGMKLIILYSALTAWHSGGTTTSVANMNQIMVTDYHSKVIYSANFGGVATNVVLLRLLRVPDRIPQQLFFQQLVVIGREHLFNLQDAHHYFVPGG